MHIRVPAARHHQAQLHAHDVSFKMCAHMRTLAHAVASIPSVLTSVLHRLAADWFRLDDPIYPVAELAKRLVPVALRAGYGNGTRRARCLFINVRIGPARDVARVQEIFQREAPDTPMLLSMQAASMCMWTERSTLRQRLLVTTFLFAKQVPLIECHQEHMTSAIT